MYTIRHFKFEHFYYFSFNYIIFIFICIDYVCNTAVNTHEITQVCYIYINSPSDLGFHGLILLLLMKLRFFKILDLKITYTFTSSRNMSKKTEREKS